MKSKFGKIWRLTMVMALVLALVPVLAVTSPVGAVGPDLDCEDVEVTVTPEVVACGATDEYKCFTVSNNGDNGDIRTFQVDVPVDGTGEPVYDVTFIWTPSGWSVDYEIHVGSGKVSRIRWYTSTNPIGSGGSQGFSIDTNVPGAGTYTWLWYVWETTEDCTLGCDPVTPDCFGEVYQDVDCDLPEIDLTCLGVDCDSDVQYDDGGYTVEATITDASDNLVGATVYYTTHPDLCDADEAEWASVAMVDQGGDLWSAVIDPSPNAHSTNVAYYIVAVDEAENETTSDCCEFHIDGQGPVLDISISPEPGSCYELGEMLTITVTSDEDVYSESGDPDDVPVVVVTDGDAVELDITDTVNPLGGNVWEYTYETAVDSHHTVTATAYDCVGNEGSEEVYFDVDGIAPPCPDVIGEACPLENKLWWECVEDDGEHCPRGDVFYRVYRNGSLIYTSAVGECYPESGDPWIDTTGGLVDGETYSYEVRAVDERNNESSGCAPVELTYFVGQEPHPYEIDICAGWNMISLPKIPFDPSTEAVLLGVLDQEGEVVWGYDPDTGWHSRNHLGAGELAQMVDGQGYWFYSLVAGTVTGQGWDMAVGPVIPPLYPVQAGWNLIGFKSQEEMYPVDYLWRLLVADATGSAIFEMGYSVFEEWWDTWGYAAWMAHVDTWAADDVFPSEADWWGWWHAEGEAAFDAHVGQYHTLEWQQMQVSLELQFSNLLMMLFGYDCDCEFLDYYVPSMMVPGQGYWLYVPDGGEILPIGMEYLFFLQVMGGGGYCPDGLCL